MQTKVILGTKKKDGIQISDFTTEESNTLMLELAKKLKPLFQDAKEEYDYDEARLKKVRLVSADGSITADINYIPIDPFGEKQAEIRTVLRMKPDIDCSAFRQAINSNDFSVAEV